MSIFKVFYDPLLVFFWYVVPTKGENNFRSNIESYELVQFQSCIWRNLQKKKLKKVLIYYYTEREIRLFQIMMRTKYLIDLLIMFSESFDKFLILYQ